MRKHLALFLASICLTLSASGQTVSLSTNNVVINFASFGITPANVSSITVKAHNWMVDGHIFRPNDPQPISRASYPQLTNGSVVFSNQLCGVAYQLTIATFWSNYTTNYFVPTTGAITNADGSIDAAQYVGTYVSPTAFYYAFLTGFQFATNYTTIYTTNTVNNTNSFNITNNLSGTNLTVVLTSATPGINGNVLSLNTNYDSGGAAATASNGIVSQFISLTNKFANTNDGWWDVAGTARASTNKLVATNDTTWFDPKNASKQSTNDLAAFVAANYASFTALMTTDTLVRATIIASNLAEVTRVTAQIGATNTLIHSDIGSTNAVEVTRVTAQIAAANTATLTISTNLANAAQTNAMIVATNVAAAVQIYAVGISNNVVASSNANASALSSSSITISNRIAYDESKFGCNTNFILTTGGTGADATANGTNVFQSATSWTNLTGNSYITNDAAGSRIYISGIAACGATIGYPVGGTFTNINSTGTPPTTSFFTAGTAAGSNMTKTSAFGVDTFSSTGGGSGSATNVFVGAGSHVSVITNGTVFTVSADSQTNGFGDVVTHSASEFSRTNINWTQVTNPPSIYPSNNPSGFVTATITNGFETSSHAAATYYPTSNPSLFVTAGITNGLAGTNFASATVNGILQSNDWQTFNSKDAGGAAATVGANCTNFAMVVSNAVYQAGTNAPSSQSAFNATNGMQNGAFTDTNTFKVTITNIAQSISSSANFIASTNGTGIGTTLTTSKSIGVTNLTIFSDENANGKSITNANSFNGTSVTVTNFISVTNSGTATTLYSNKVSTANIEGRTNNALNIYSTTTGDGLDVDITASSGIASANNGGNVLITAGSGGLSGTNSAGNITLQAGVRGAGSGHTGNIYIYPGISDLFSQAGGTNYIGVDYGFGIYTHNYLIGNNYIRDPIVQGIQANKLANMFTMLEPIGYAANPIQILDSNNASMFLISSNGGVGIGGLTGYLTPSTNIVKVWNAGVGSANGNYFRLSATSLTNLDVGGAGNGSDLIFSNPTWFQRTNGVNLYSTTNLSAGSTWLNVIGATIVPQSSYGYTNDFGGVIIANFTAPSNLVNFITNAAAQAAQAVTNGSIPFSLSVVTNVANGAYSNNPAGYVTASITNTLQVTNANLTQWSGISTNGYAQTVTNIAQSLIAAQTLTPSTVLTNETIAGVPTRTNFSGKLQMSKFGFTNVNGVYLKIAANVWTNNLYNGAFVQSNGVTWTDYTNSTSLALYTSSDGQNWVVNNGQSPAGISRIGTLEDFNLTADAVTNIPGSSIVPNTVQAASAITATSAPNGLILASMASMDTNTIALHIGGGGASYYTNAFNGSYVGVAGAGYYTNGFFVDTDTGATNFTGNWALLLPQFGELITTNQPQLTGDFPEIGTGIRYVTSYTKLAAADGSLLTNLGTSGIVTLTGGTNKVSANFQTNVLMTYVSLDGTVSALFLKPAEWSAGNYFTIRSSNSSDTNQVYWYLKP